MKYVFVDMDGTIAEWGYPDGRISGDYKFGDYLGKHPIDDVIAEIYNAYSSSQENQEKYIIIVVSAVPNSKAVMEKNIWLDNFFNVPSSNRIFIGKEEDKIDIIDFYMKNIAGLEPKGNSILIDDRKDWLLKGKDIGMEVYHPTKIIASFQNRMLELQKQEQKEPNEPAAQSEQQNTENASGKDLADNAEAISEES